MGNPPYPGWTATGGPNWIGTMSTSLNNSLVLTYNYAYGGATIDANLVKPYQPTVLSLTDQINGQFLAKGGASSKPSSSPWTSENSLFSVWIGINDISGSFWQGGDRAAFSQTLFDAEFKLVQAMYDVGARNFLFLNVPAVHRSPAFLITDVSNQQLAQSVLEIHNKIYVDRVKQFASSNTGVKTWIWDSYTEFNKILDSLAEHGFNPDPLAYGGKTDFWGNDFHPSAAAHTLFAQSIRKLLGNTRW
jgi:phospholipase/lecithinase/hemolysin